ncbi:MAG: hypothetical protein E7058_02440 [Lentisphaerae bacterium]|nr:hypothetical protein [Lentisphaerota bacterium]
MQNKKIITVTGEVDIGQCQKVLSHEHLFIDITNQAAPGASEKTISPADRQQLMRDPYSIRDNLLLNDPDEVVRECQTLQLYGCDTIVDCSTPQIGRDPEVLKKVSMQTGTKIVMGCGYYTADTHPAEFTAISAETAAAVLIDEIKNGINGIRPGVIGEIGTSKEIMPDEKKALRAAAIAHQDCGLAVQVHIFPWSTNGLEAMDILMAGGVAPEKIVICHSDVEPNWKYISQLLKCGVYVELDNFGKEFTPAPDGFAAGKFIPDIERAELAAKIIDAGFGSQLLITNDICLKCMLPSCGGEGYSHIFRNAVPMIADCGIDETYLKEVVLRQNPLTVLAV